MLGSLTVLLAGPTFAGGRSSSALTASASADTGRDPFVWPFSKDSIWNLPLGADAVYVPVSIKPPQSAGMTTDPDVLILTPNAPNTPVYYNSDAWSGGSRCNAQGGVLFEAPIPADFVVPGAHSGFTPNFATAILLADGHTLEQGQPMARCTPNGTATMWWHGTNDLYDTGQYGGHGGSMLSSIGGTIRLGELVPGGVIRHVMKANLFGEDDYWYDSATQGYRWPARQADSCASGCYRGSNPVLRMGSLLALPPSVDINTMGLETAPAKILATAFQDYGAYTVDDTAWSVYGIATEFSPQGRIEDEFSTAWGFAIDPSALDVPWARDMRRIFGALNVVDNWDATAWGVVSASAGSLGVGGGAPRVAWAPDFGADTTPPQTSASIAGTAGTANWFLSSVSVTVSATDAGSGVAAIHVRSDGGFWNTYTSPVPINGEGPHTFDFYATDVAGNDGPVQTKAVGIDTVAPASGVSVVGQSTGDGGYTSPVTIILTSTDATSGVASIQYRIDGGAWRTYAGPFPLAGNGAHTLEVTANDVAGNLEAVQPSSILLSGASGTPPITLMTAQGTAGANGWYVSRVTVTLSASSGSGSATTIFYRLDGGFWFTYAAPLGIADGAHVLDYQASDSAGYVEPSKTAAIAVDSIAPTIEATSAAVIPLDGSVSWTGSDGVSGIERYEVSIDGAAFESVGSQTSVTRTWAEGHHLAVVRAWDAAGNVAMQSIDFTVDRNASPQTPTQPPQFALPFGLNASPSSMLVVLVLVTLLTVTMLLRYRLKRDQSLGPAAKPRSPPFARTIPSSSEVSDDPWDEL